MTTPAELLGIIRTRGTTTRAELVEATGLSRTAVQVRVDELLFKGLITETGGSGSRPGRPAQELRFNAHSGVLLVAALGSSHVRVAVSDMRGRPLAEFGEQLGITAGPGAVLPRVMALFGWLLEEKGVSADDVRGVGIGVPGSIAFGRGTPVSPPAMPGWDGFSISNWFTSVYGVPVVVENDANVMGMAEQRLAWPTVRHLLYVKVGTGIGAALITDGHIVRGAQGAAGDIGHLPVPEGEGVLCRCGNFGCLEAIAGGWALSRRLRVHGMVAASNGDVLGHVRSGDMEAIRIARDAGRQIGSVLAWGVNMFNPAVIALGGEIGDGHHHLLTGMRERIYERSLPLATRDLQVVTGRLGGRAGVLGAGLLIAEEVIDIRIRALA